MDVDAPAATAAVPIRGPAEVPVVLTVNGRDHVLELEPRVSLLDALREHLGLTGTKKGCDQGTCGACTVLVDGRRVLACLTLAVSLRGPRDHHDRGARARAARCTRCSRRSSTTTRFQCGYCTPGQIMSAVALLAEGHAGDRRRDPRVHERQHLPLRGLPEHPRRRSARSRRHGRRHDAAVRLRPRDRRRRRRRRGRRRPGQRRSWPAAPTEVDLLQAGVAAPEHCWSTSTRCRWPRSRTVPTAACASARSPG